MVRRAGCYKIGFSWQSVDRRVRDAKGELVLVIPARYPSVLENVLHRRYAAQRVSVVDGCPVGREWFVLDESDLTWLSGLGAELGVSQP